MLRKGVAVMKTYWSTCRPQHRAAVLHEVLRIIRSTAKEAHPQGCPAK